MTSMKGWGWVTHRVSVGEGEASVVLHASAFRVSQNLKERSAHLYRVN